MRRLAGTRVKRNGLLFVVAFGVLLLAGCDLFGSSESSTQDTALKKQLAAQERELGDLKAALAVLQATPTVTATPLPPSPTASATVTASPTSTPVPPTVTPIPASIAVAPVPPPLPAAATPTQEASVPQYNYYGFNVGALGNYRYPVRAGATQRVQGYFQVGQNRNVEFSVQDPFGNVIYNPGLVFGRHEFTFLPMETGVYQLVFHNGALLTTREIALWWR